MNLKLENCGTNSVPAIKSGNNSVPKILIVQLVPPLVSPNIAGNGLSPIFNRKYLFIQVFFPVAMLSLNAVLMASRPTDPPTVTSPEIAGLMGL